MKLINLLSSTILNKHRNKSVLILILIINIEYCSIQGKSSIF